MNYTQFAENPNELVFVTFGVIIYFIFRLLQYLSSRKSANNSKQFLIRIFYFVEILTWLAYFSEGINLFLHKNMVFSGIYSFLLFVTTGWIAWYILRDFFAGLFLKMDHTFKLDEIIEFDNISGKIIKIGSREVELEMEGLNKIKIPYNQFFIKRLIRTGTSDNCAKGDFVFKLNPKLNAIETLDLIKVFIYQLPWTSTTQPQEVSIEKKENQDTFIRVNASLFDKKYQDRFEQKVRERFE